MLLNKKLFTYKALHDQAFAHCPYILNCWPS